MSTTEADREDTVAAINIIEALMKEYSADCAPTYACADDENSPCEIRTRIRSALCDKLLRIVFF